MINFFTSCTGKYKMFVYPYISSILINVPNSFVEIIVDDLSYFSQQELDKLKDLFKDRFKIRNYKKELNGWNLNLLSNLQTNAIRFLDQPNFMCDTTYIGDIDILVLDSNIETNHIDHCEMINLPYSNVKRQGQTRLSGLHFVKSKEYFTKITKEFQNIVINQINSKRAPFYSDEHLLFQMMVESFGVPSDSKREVCFPNAEPLKVQYMYRPQHGLHTSPNRNNIEHSTDGWGFSLDRNNKYKKMSETDEWNIAKELFNQDYNKILQNINKVVYE